MRRVLSKIARSTAALGAVFFVSVALSACGGIPGNAVVKVGDQSITKDQFNHWMGIAAASTQSTSPGQPAPPKPAVPVPPDFAACITQKRATAPKPAAGQPNPTDAQFKAQCQQSYNSLRDQVLSFLISANWINGEAKDQSVSVKDSDVQARFNQIKTQQFPKDADFQNFLKTSGQSVADLLYRVRLDLLSTKIRDKVTKGQGTVTPAQISDYYNKNQSRFGQPERRDLRIILTKTQAEANAAKAQVQGGQSFASVAKRVSTDQASKAQGGALLNVARGTQEKALDDAVFAAQRGVLSGPIKTQFGFYVFQVQKITAGSQQTLAQASNTIKQQLTAQNQQAALDAFVKKFRKKWTGKTDCRSGFVVQSCKQYKAPKTTPGAGTTVPVTPQTGGATTTPQSGGATTAPATPPASGSGTTSTGR